MNNKIYFTPGPSELYPTIGKHIQQALDDKIGAISHRSKQFQEIYAHTENQLRTFLKLPDNYTILFLASATEIWERILQNTVAHTSFHLVNGSFSKKFYECAGELSRTGLKVEAKFGEGFYPEQIAVPAETETICLTHNETSSGVSMPVADINQFRAKHAEALIYVDSVSSLPYPEFDYSKIDSTYFSVQKCFGMPAGLGVWLVNERVIAKAEAMDKKGISIGTYHTLPSLLSKAKENQTPETCNVLYIYLLGKIVEDMNKIGVTEIRMAIDRKAKLVYDYLQKSKVFSPAVADVRLRSQTTIVANTSIGSAEVNKQLAAFDMAVGTGYGNYKDQQIRIANFPAHSEHDMQQLVAKLQACFG